MREPTAQEVINMCGSGPVAIALVLEITKVIRAKGGALLTSDESSFGFRLLEFADLVEGQINSPPTTEGGA